MNIRRTAGFACLLSALLAPQAVSASGDIEFRELLPGFYPRHGTAAYLAGSLGVIDPSYYRRYLFFAYRQLLGKPFTRQEQDAFLNWTDSPDTVDESVAEWMMLTRDKGLPREGMVIFRAAQNTSMDFYRNCTQDAFRTAVRAYHERVAKFGAGSEAVNAWLSAQVIVFSNCAKGENIPENAPDVLPELIRQDRAYQIAAAYFYSEKYDLAARHFDAIAKDAASPWHTLAPYLSARALLRKATLDADPGNATVAANEAARRLTAIIADPQLASMHQAARGSQRLLMLHHDPGAALGQIEASLMSGTSRLGLQQELIDYQWLMDQMDPSDPRMAGIRLSPGGPTDWIMTVQAGHRSRYDSANDDRRRAGFAHATEMWKKQPDDAWALANLLLASRTSELPAGLLTQVHGWGKLHPGYQTAQLRLLWLQEREVAALQLRGKPLDAARQSILNTARDLLASRSFLPEGRNALRELILRHTDRIEDAESVALLEDLPPIYYYAMGEQWNTPGKLIEQPIPALWTEGRQWFDTALPLSVMEKLLQRRKLEPWLWRNLAIAAWTRAVAIGDHDSARRLSPYLREAVPNLGPPLEQYLSAALADRDFAAADILVRHRALSPNVSVLTQRSASVSAGEVFAQDYWWCPESMAMELRSRTGFAVAGFPARMLSAAEREQAAHEVAELRKLDNATNHLSRLVIRRAEQSPQDPRVPEDMYLMIRVTRSGCINPDTSTLSRQMFRILHSKYKNSAWAKKTKYHY